MTAHLLANLRTYAAAIVLVGGAVLSANVLGDQVARDVAIVVAVAGAVAVPAPKSTKVTASTGRRQG